MKRLQLLSMVHSFTVNLSGSLQRAESGIFCILMVILIKAHLNLQRSLGFCRTKLLLPSLFSGLCRSTESDLEPCP